MQYRRAHLIGREWHKIVLNRGSSEHKRVSLWLKANLPPESFMCKGVSGHFNVMISNLDDFVLARLALDFTSKEMRGCKEWAKAMDERDRLYYQRMQLMWANKVRKPQIIVKKC